MIKKLKAQLTESVGAVWVEVEGFTAKFYSEEDGRLVCTYSMKTGKISMR